MTTKDRQAIARAVQALDDWVVTYAAEFADQDSLDETGHRIRANGGTLAYITDVREGLERVLAKEKRPNKP